ncbi:hypothetical protein [Vibrio rumoiensis]|uniref:Uncharacterized protein n=1 Tax=Vibrio rumoiensis TaxID=76258 RepID=A0ABW7J004_9VIBR
MRLYRVIKGGADRYMMYDGKEEKEISREEFARLWAENGGRV